jgi:hypothetical protein
MASSWHTAAARGSPSRPRNAVPIQKSWPLAWLNDQWKGLPAARRMPRIPSQPTFQLQRRRRADQRPTDRLQRSHEACAETHFGRGFRRAAGRPASPAASGTRIDYTAPLRPSAAPAPNALHRMVSGSARSQAASGNARNAINRPAGHAPAHVVPAPASTRIDGLYMRGQHLRARCLVLGLSQRSSPSMSSNTRRDIIDGIRSHIKSHGYHVTVVQGGPVPRFAYTIGLHDKVGFELVFAGGAFYTFDEILRLINEVARLTILRNQVNSTSLVVNQLGSMSLREVEPSWGSKILLGALDYYGVEHINALQINPDSEHWTMDIPNMSASWSPASHQIWKWLEVAWRYPVSPKSKAITNLDALRGQPITEVARWEDSEWELFAGAGPDVDKADIRVVPLGTMLGHDATLECVIELAVGDGLWREGGGEAWHLWGNRDG